MTRTMDGWKNVLVAGMLTAALNGAALAAEPLNINAASAEELAAAMEGVGQAKAQAIINYREQNGRFKSIDELARVSGISPRIVDASRERLTAE